MMKIPVLLLLTFSVSAQAAWYENWSAKPAWPEPISFASGTAATLTVLAFRKTMVDDFQHYESTRRPLGHWSEYGDYFGQGLPNLIYAAGMITASYYGANQAGERAQMMIMTTAEAVLITTVLKYTIRSKRPDGGNRDTFPSGHTTSAFAFASVVGVEHGWRWGVPAYLAASFAGWSRINDNKHYLQDVIAGATVGISTGLGIYYARERRKEGAAEYRVLPLPIDDGGGVFFEARW
ncbi:MAG: phosphatase PAP2 family protein [Bdellovibrionales bacterium]|nr:phosphatase PAP2 family protein [Bdellovibrionales bacterium]